MKNVISLPECGACTRKLRTRRWRCPECGDEFCYTCTQEACGLCPLCEPPELEEVEK